MPRFFVDLPLSAGAELALPAGAARHVQVLRLQPGRHITLFNGQGGQWQASITQMGRSDVTVRIDTHQAIEREAPRRVHLTLGMPANERMDWLVEKAGELGAASIQPLHTAHSVMRLAAERATKKQQHWQQVAVAACEQCGGNRVPAVHAVQDFSAWLTSPASADTSGTSLALRCVLSLADGSQPLASVLVAHPSAEVFFLSGPEGGLSPSEDAQARAAGFWPVSLGPRVLRAETAALAALVHALA